MSAVQETESSPVTQYVANLTLSMRRQYDRNVNKDLSQQKWQDLFKRNVIAMFQQVFNDTLLYLQQTPDVAAQWFSYHEQQETAFAFKPFDDLVDEFMQYTLQKHRTSCALSNFPDEHNPSQKYLAEVLEIVYRDLHDFKQQANAFKPRPADTKHD